MKSQTMVLPDGTRMELIHLAFRDRDDAAWRIACVPNLDAAAATPTRPWPYRRTNDCRAVTCPNCKETGAYRAAQASMDLLGAI